MRQSRISVIEEPTVAPRKVLLCEIPPGTYFTGRISGFPNRLLFKGWETIYAVNDPTNLSWRCENSAVEDFRVVDVEIKVVTP